MSNWKHPRRRRARRSRRPGRAGEPAGRDSALCLGHRRGRRRHPPRAVLGRGGDVARAPAQADPPRLTALAAPLVVLAILSAIVTNDIHGRQGALMMVFYLINTLVAMVIGLTLTNLIQPGIGAALAEPGAAAPTAGPEDRRPTS